MGKVRSANACLIVIRNSIIGITTSLRLAGDFNLQDQAGIGDNVIVEYVPGIARVNVSLSGVLLISQNYTAAGILPANSVRDILNQEPFDVGVYSTIPGTMTPNALLIKAIDCMPSSVGYSFDAGQATKYDHSFVARDMAGQLLG